MSGLLSSDWCLRCAFWEDWKRTGHHRRCPGPGRRICTLQQATMPVRPQTCRPVTYWQHAHNRNRNGQSGSAVFNVVKLL